MELDADFNSQIPHAFLPTPLLNCANINSLKKVAFG